MLLLVGLIVTETGYRIEKGKTVFGHYLGKWRRARVAKWTGTLAVLVAMVGCLSWLFVLGLCGSIVALGRCLDQTWRDRLDWMPPGILIIGFFVGHWWQGRLGEGAGLFALLFGFSFAFVM